MESAQVEIRRDVKPDWWSSDEWTTPMYVFSRIDALYGPFDLDPCCRAETAKAPQFYTKSDNGLSRMWFGRVWVNPPYSEPRIWIEKAIESVAVCAATRVVMLLPAAIDTTWFHDLVLPHAEAECARLRGVLQDVFMAIAEAVRTAVKEP